GTAVRKPLDAAIGVEAAEEVVAVVGERRRCEPEEQDVGASPSAPAAEGPGVQVDTVDQPRKEGGGLLRVPLPIDAPGVMRPHRTEDQAQREQWESDAD